MKRLTPLGQFVVGVIIGLIIGLTVTWALAAITQSDFPAKTFEDQSAYYPPKELSTVWLGEFPVGDAWNGGVGWCPNHQIGLRSDGIVVWREKPKKEETK